MEWRKNDFLLTDDQRLADMDRVVAWLRTSYWAETRPEAVIRKSFANSTGFFMFKKSRQVAMARVVGDHAVFAWLADVFVDPDFRGLGLGKWLVECILEHPMAKDLTVVLGTTDAHGLYAQYGFVPFERAMIKPSKERLNRKECNRNDT